MATRKAITLVSGLFQEVNTPTDKLDFAGNTTADLTENTNLYYTNARVKGSYLCHRCLRRFRKSCIQ